MIDFKTKALIDLLYYTYKGFSFYTSVEIINKLIQNFSCQITIRNNPKLPIP